METALPVNHQKLHYLHTHTGCKPINISLVEVKQTVFIWLYSKMQLKLKQFLNEQIFVLKIRSFIDGYPVNVRMKTYIPSCTCMQNFCVRQFCYSSRRSPKLSQTERNEKEGILTYIYIYIYMYIYGERDREIVSLGQEAQKMQPHTLHGSLKFK